MIEVMAHKSFKGLELILQQAAREVELNGTYVHYKDPNSRYVVRGFTILEASDEAAVRYCHVNAPSIEFTRPLVSWLEEVEYNGKIVPRFRKV